MFSDMFSTTVHHAALWAFIVSMIPKFFRNRISESSHFLGDTKVFKSLLLGKTTLTLELDSPSDSTALSTSVTVIDCGHLYS